MKEHHSRALVVKGILAASLISVSLLFSNCTEQRYAFREKIKVEPDIELAVAKKVKAKISNPEIVATNFDVSSSSTKTEKISLQQNEELLTSSTEKNIRINNVPQQQYLVTTNNIQTTSYEKINKHILEKSDDPEPKEKNKLNKTNKNAILGFTFSLIGLIGYLTIIIPLILAPYGIKFSLMGIRETNRQSENHKGHGLAISGLIIGSIVALFDIVIIAFVIALLSGGGFHDI